MEGLVLMHHETTVVDSYLEIEMARNAKLWRSGLWNVNAIHRLAFDSNDDISSHRFVYKIFK